MENRKQSNRGGQSVKRSQTRREKDIFRGEYVIGLSPCSLRVGDGYYLVSLQKKGQVSRTFVNWKSQLNAYRDDTT